MIRLALLLCLSLFALPAAAQESRAPASGEVADAQRADQDERINVSVRMASDAQAYFLKPTEFNGGNDSFEGVSLKTLQYRINGDGHHVRASDNGATHTYALDLTDGVVTIVASSDQHESVIRTTVTGPKVENISISF